MLGLSAFSFEKVKTINFENEDYSRIDQLRIKFLFNNSTISTNNAVEINDIIEMCENCFAVITYENGKSTVLSKYDLSKLNNHNPLILLNDKEVSSLGDTLVIGEDELLKIENNSLLETELNSVLDVTYQLNTSKLNNQEIKQYFKPSSIIFPFDLSTKRWLSDIKTITIYKSE